MAKINNVWNLIEESGKKPFIRVGKERDLMIALNYYEPGYKNQFHHHWGTSQSFLVMRGELTLRTRKNTQAPVEEFVLKEGECCIMEMGEYYQLENASSGPLVLYQAKQPTDKFQLLGKDPVDAREQFGDAI